MSTRRKLVRIAGVLLLAAPAIAAEALTVSADFFGGVDLSTYRTWSWREGKPADDHRIEQHIRCAVEAQLAAKGWVKTDGEADLYVVTQAMRDNLFFLGLLRIDVNDARSRQLIFSAQAGDATPESLKKAKKVVDKAVRKMLKTFPERGRE